MSDNARRLIAATEGHTPGEWSVATSNRRYPQVIRWSDKQRKYDVFVAELRCGECPGEQKPNAALIAAAPDLRAELIAALDEADALRAKLAAAEEQNDAAERRFNEANAVLNDCIGHMREFFESTPQRKAAAILGFKMHVCLTGYAVALEQKLAAAEKERDGLAEMCRGMREALEDYDTCRIKEPTLKDRQDLLEKSTALLALTPTAAEERARENERKAEALETAVSDWWGHKASAHDCMVGLASYLAVNQAAKGAGNAGE